jgi:hypothetical protein
VKPLAQNLLSDPSAVESLLAGRSGATQLLGFFLDSPLGALKRSGLIEHRSSVMPLDQLLGDRATLYYVDPRQSDASHTSYRTAVRAFADQVMGAGVAPFRLQAPCLLLINTQSDRSALLDCLELDPKATCIWYLQVRNDQTSSAPEKSRLTQTLEALSSHRLEISMEVLKVGLGSLISSLISSR